MSKSLFRVVGVMLFGCSFQFLGCDSGKIAEVLASSVRDTAVEVGTIALESFVDGALGLE
jgi:hypothetical protein